MRRRVKLKRKLLTIASVLLLGVSLFAVTPAAPANAGNLFHAEGTVYCMNGGPVVGVYVYVNDGGANGFADITPDGSISAGFSYGLGLIPRGFWLAVGCGGTPDHWATTSYEEPSSGLPPVFDYDIYCSNQGSNGPCYAFDVEAE